MIEHRHREGIAFFGGDVQSEVVKVETIGDVVRGFAKASRDVLEPPRNDHLSKRQFPGGHDLCLGSSKSLQMLNQISARASVGRDPLCGVPGSSYPDV